MSSTLKIISILLCVFMFACSSSSKNDDKTDTGETVTDSDSDAADTDSTDTEPTGDTTPDNSDSDNPDTTPGNNDSENNDDADTASEQNDDDADTESEQNDDNADTEPEQADDDSDTESEQTEAEKCADTGGIWNGFECLNPCDAAPCSNFSYTTGKCIPLNSTVYYCECEEDYYWHGEKGGCKTERPALGNICTGQDKCFNDSEEMTCPAEDEDFSGQDFQYADLGTCIPKAFRVETMSGDNVVVDINTELMWQQVILTETLTWEDAVSHCENLEYAGYSDWRLPNPQELLTIVDNSKYGPAVNTAYFPNMPSYTSLWTSNKYTDSEPYSFSSYEGGISYESKTTPCNVMCVRGEELFNESSFTTQTMSGKVVVKDYTTGLMWQKAYQSSQTWQEALNYCETSTYAGYTDWRLPNKNELASLLNYAEPYSNFPDMPISDAFFWSSSTYYSSIMFAWRVVFHSGNVGFYPKTGEFYVRCVR